MAIINLPFCPISKPLSKEFLKKHTAFRAMKTLFLLFLFLLPFVQVRAQNIMADTTQAILPWAVPRSVKALSRECYHLHQALW